MIISLLKQRQQRKHYPTKRFVYRFFFLFCVNGTPSFLAIVARYFMSADFTSHCICLTSVTIPLCGLVHRVQSNHIKQVRGSLLSGLGIRFQNLNLLHIDQITGLKSLSIYLFLLAQLNVGLQMVSETTCRALCYSVADCLRGVRTYLHGTVLQWCRLFKQCQNLPTGHCVIGLQTV